MQINSMEEENAVRVTEMGETARFEIVILIIIHNHFLKKGNHQPECDKH